MDKAFKVGLAVCATAFATILILGFTQGAQGEYMSFYEFDHPVDRHDDILPFSYYINRSDPLGGYYTFFNPNNLHINYTHHDIRTIQDGPWTIIPKTSHLSKVINLNESAILLVNGTSIPLRDSEAVSLSDIHLFEYQREQIESLQQHVADLQYDMAKLQKKISLLEK